MGNFEDIGNLHHHIARVASTNANDSTVTPTLVSQGGEGNLQISGTFITPGDGFRYLTYGTYPFP